MATTGLSLGEHWEAFIESEVSCGRYGSASEVVRDALQHMEARQRTLEALRTHLAEGEVQALRGEFVDDYFGIPHQRMDVVDYWTPASRE